MNLLKILYYGLFSASLVALLINLHRLQPRHRAFAPLLILGLLTQVAGDILKANGLEHYFVFHIYVPIEYALLSLYYASFFRARWQRILLVLSNIILIVYCINRYYTTSLFWQLDFRHFVLLSTFITVLTISFFIRLLRSEEQLSLSRYPDFWINAGHLLFYPCCFFVMGLVNELVENEALVSELFLINNYFNIILYVFYLIGFTCKTRKVK